MTGRRWGQPRWVWFVLGWLALAFGGMQAQHAQNTGEVIGGSVCVRVRGLRAHCRRGASAVRDAADSTNSSAFSCAGEPAAAEFA